MSAGNINILMELWERLSATSDRDGCTPFTNSGAMYRHIDAITYSKLDWLSFTLLYGDESDDPEVQPAWMKDPQIVWYRDPLSVLRSVIANPAFNGSFDYTPYHEYRHGVHHFQNFMSGDWAWRQAVSIFSYSFLQLHRDPIYQSELGEDPGNHGAFFVPIILGSDKTTVSVATGNNEYWPLYMSIGNLHNSARRAHKNGLVVLGFFPIPKGMPAQWSVAVA